MIEALGWLLLNLLSLLVLSFYSMSEMACVSFNKVRLHYYVSQQNKAALLIQYLLENPAKLFGTTLIGVNIAMFCGSEFARQFHQSLGLNPDLAPLSQVLIVLIFGELAPMFAARRYPEKISLLSAPIMWLSIKIMSPLLWGIEKITTLAQKLIGGHSSSSDIFLSQEELQILIGELEEKHKISEGEEFNTIVSNIFALRNLSVERLMIPLSRVTTVPKEYTVDQLRFFMEKSDKELFPVYDKSLRNIVGIIIPRQLLRVKKEDKIASHLITPWFITQNAHLSEVLRQFRTNKQNLAVVLNNKGRAIGILHLEQILKAIFTVEGSMRWNSKLPYIEKTVSGEMLIKEFNRLFPAPLEENEEMTLDEYCYHHFGHHPEKGESLFLSPYLFEVKESSLLEIKSLTVKVVPKYTERDSKTGSV